MAYSPGLAPPSTPFVIPVNVALPVFRSVKVCVGSSPQAILCAVVVPGQFRVSDTVQVAGVRVALTTGATAPNSTAPTSYPVPAGLTLPKKSVNGAAVPPELATGM